MVTHLITDKEVKELDDIIMKLENLSALATVCGSAFIDKNSFSNVAPMEVHQTFNNISNQIGEISADASGIMAAIYGNRQKEGAENE